MTDGLILYECIIMKPVGIPTDKEIVNLHFIVCMVHKHTATQRWGTELLRTELKNFLSYIIFYISFSYLCYV